MDVESVLMMCAVVTSSENGEHQKLKLTTDLGLILAAQGIISTPEPLSVPPDSPMAPSWPNMTTSRCYARRARKELDWKPKFLLEDMFEGEMLDVLSVVRSES